MTLFQMTLLVIALCAFGDVLLFVIYRSARLLMRTALEIREWLDEVRS